MIPYLFMFRWRHHEWLFPPRLVMHGGIGLRALFWTLLALVVIDVYGFLTQDFTTGGALRLIATQMTIPVVMATCSFVLWLAKERT